MMTGDKPTTARVLILAAVRTEVANLLTADRTADGLAVPACRGGQALVCVTGMGANRMTRAARQAIEQHQPDLLINVGFAGGLDVALAGGEVVVITRVCNEQGDCHELVVPHLPTRQAPLVSVDHVVCTPVQKQQLSLTTGAQVVDMEGHALACLAKQHDLPLVMFKAISDPADAALPAASAQWVGEDGTPDAIRAAWFALTRPWWIGRLVRLGKDTKAGAAQLADQVRLLLDEPR